MGAFELLINHLWRLLEKIILIKFKTDNNYKSYTFNRLNMKRAERVEYQDVYLNCIVSLERYIFYDNIFIMK